MKLYMNLLNINFIINNYKTFENMKHFDSFISLDVHYA